MSDELHAGDAAVDPSGQPSGDPQAMAQEYGYCPLISNTTAAMAQMGSGLAPGRSSAQPVVFPMYAPCVGPRCAWWFAGGGRPMCSVVRIAYDLKALGDQADRTKINQ